MRFFRLGHLSWLVFYLVALCEGSKILGVFPTRWTSHWKVGTSVMKHLAAAGHDVTIVSPFQSNMANVRDIILTNYPQGESATQMQILSSFHIAELSIADPMKNIFDASKLTALMNFIILPDMLSDAINFTLSHPNMRKLMNEKFDLVIIEVFHSEALLGKRSDLILF
jgi:hypothetical protein